MVDLKDKVAIITGCGRPNGIGRSCALALAEAGAAVVVTDVCKDFDPAIRLHGVGDFETLEALVDDIEQAGGRALAVRCDVTSKEQVEALVAQTLAAFDRLDILVNNAGCAVGVGPIDMITEQAWDTTMAVNVKGAFLLSQAALEPLKRGGGKIVNMSSQAGLSAGPRYGAYAASKHGIIGLTQVLGRELAPFGVQVNAICPGLIDTDMGWEQYQFLAMLEGVEVDTVRETLLARIPSGRFGTPEDVARVCLFLASPLSDYMSGEALRVSGGYSR